MAHLTDEKADVAAPATNGAPARGDASSPARRTYTAPQLRYLGKVADVTFGHGGSVLDVAGHPHLGSKHG